MAAVWWGNETYSHGLLILPISIWLIWRNKHVFSQAKLEPSWLGLMGFCAGAFGWLLGALADVNVVQHLGVVTMLAASIPLVFGLKLTKLLLFPIGFLFFMVPTGEFLVPTLMKHTADATIKALELSGIPVFRENMHFTLPTGRWSVVEACSGLRYIIAALVLAFMFAYLNYRSWTKKVLFVMVCLIIAVIANWIRAYLVVLVGHFSGMKYGTGDDHIYYGWFFFGVVMFAIFWFGMRWRDDGMDTPNSVTPIAANNTVNPPTSPVVNSNFGFKLAAVFLGIGSMAAAHYAPAALLDTKPRIDLTTAFESLNLGFKRVDTLAVSPTFKSPKAEIKASAPNSSEIYIAYYAKQSDDSEMITGNNYFVSSSDPKWTIMASAARGQGLFSGLSAVTELTLKTTGDAQQLAWMWYCVGGFCVKEGSLTKGLTAVSALRGKGDHSLAILVSTPIVAGNVDAAREVLAKQKIALDPFATKFTALN